MAAAPSLLDWPQHPHNWVVPKLYAEPPPHTHTPLQRTGSGEYLKFPREMQCQGSSGPG